MTIARGVPGVFQTVHLSDVRVVERQDFRPAPKPRQSIGIIGEGVRQDLQGESRLSFVSRAIHLAHTAHAERGDDFARAEAPASGHWRKCGLILATGVPGRARE